MCGYASLTLTRQHHGILALKIAQGPRNAHENTEEKKKKQSTPDRPRFFVFPISRKTSDAAAGSSHSSMDIQM